MRHIFKAIKPQRMLQVGDLIRSDATGDYINIVLEVTPIERTVRNYWGQIKEGEFFSIRSVRYGKTCRGSFKLLSGTRSRNFTYPTINLTNWEIVDEYAAVDNEALRLGILESLRDINTGYKENDE